MKASKRILALVLIFVMAAAMFAGCSKSFDKTVVLDEDLGKEKYGIGFRKGSDACTEVNAIIAELMADGTLDALAEKYELTLVK